MLAISPRITSPQVTDFSSYRALLASPRLAGRQGEDLAIALWQLLVDRDEGLYHYCPAFERLTNHYVHDPLKLFNVFGWSICGITANTLALLARRAGLPAARTAHVIGHEATEVFYDGGWHLLDADLQAYHRRRPPNPPGIASYAECLADPTLISDQPQPSVPYYLADRPPARMAELYRTPPRVLPAFADHCHSMDYVLRPGETLTRTTAAGGRWVWFVNFDEYQERYPREWCADGPRERFPPHRRYGNGCWRYAPRLTAGWLDFAAGVHDCRNLAPTARGVEPLVPGPAECTFEFNSPWVYAGIPGPNGKVAPVKGVVLTATLNTTAAAGAFRVDLAVDPDRPWHPVWSSPGPGRHVLDLDLTAPIANAYCFRLRFVFPATGPGAAVLESLSLAAHFMIAPASLGRLVSGENELTVQYGDEYGLLTRRYLLETDFGQEADVRAKTQALTNLRFLPGTDDRVLPADPARDYAITYCLPAPARTRWQRLMVHTSVRGKAPDDPGTERVAAWWAAAPTGPWQPVYDVPVEPHPDRWHWAAEAESVFAEPLAYVYVKLTGRAGLQYGRLRLHALDDRVNEPPLPLAITHRWTEGDGAEREHRECVPAANVPHRYRLSCGEQPRLTAVVIEAPSLAGR